MGMNTFNMFGTFNIQIPDYFETHYKEENEDLSEYFIARYLPEDTDWGNYGNSEQGISVSNPINTEYEGVDFTDIQLQETILSKLKAIMDKSKESMLAGTSGIMRAIMIKALETDCPYIYHAEKDFIVLIYTESQSCSTRSAFAFFNNCAACQITFRDNRSVESDEKKNFSSNVLDSIEMDNSASGSTGKTSANTQKKKTAKSPKKPKVCPIPQDFKDHTTITDKDFRSDSILAQSVVCYVLEALSKIDLHFSSQKSDHEIGNDLFKDLVNVASFQEYQGTVMQVIGNDHYIKPLMLYTIRDFFAMIRQNGKADRDRIISSYSGLFIDILRFFYTNDRISDPELLLRGMGTLGLRYRNVIIDDITTFSKKLKQTPEKRLLAGREWVTKICSQPDLHFLCSKDKINHLMLFKYLCDDVLHFQENDFSWDETQGKHIINGIQANGEVLWNYPELFFMWNDMPKLVVEYLRAKEDSDIGISEKDKNRPRPWDAIGAWTPFALFFAATQDKVTISFSEDGHVYLCLTELLAPFESSLKKILSENFYSISPEISVVSNRSEVISHNFQWGMDVQDIGFCSGQKLYGETMTVLKEFKKEYTREIAYACPSQKFSHSPSWGFVGMGGFMGSGGVSFKSFSSVDFDRDEDGLYDQPSEQVMEKIDGLLENISEFSEEQRALHYARLFRVSETAFDKWSDRENEIRNGYLKDSRMLPTFREFVWSLASYLADHGKNFDEVTNEDIHKILDMIEARENTNYAEDSYFPALCSVSDNFSIYTDINDPDIRIAEAFTALSESESDTVNSQGNLSALRNEIRLLIPAMDLIYNELKSSRDPEKPLEGKPADILNAWCIIALAAKGNVVSATTGRLGFVWDRFTDDDNFQDSRTPSEIISGITAHWMVRDQTDKTIANENISENANLSIASDDSFIIIGTTLVKYRGSDKIVTIPEGITKIGSKVFDKNKTTEEVFLPESLISIEESAFYYRSHLKKIHFPSKLQSIGSKAFWKCTSLEEVMLPDSLTELGNNAFSECENLRNVHLSENLKKINEKTFYECKKLEEITIPDNVIVIDVSAFRYCSNLKKIHLGNKLERINGGAFLSCYKLEEIDLPQGLKFIGTECFNNAKIKSLTVPSSVCEISKGAFRSCSSLTSVTFEGKLQKIDDAVFKYCSNLQKIVFPTDLQEIGEETFYECGLESIILPITLKTIGKKAFYSCKYLKSVEVNDSVEIIPDQAFSKCENLQQIELPGYLRIIGNSSFEYCGVEELSIPSNIEIIGTDAFRYCEKLKKLVFNGIVQRLSNSAFYFCKNLHEVILPDGITEVCDYSFHTCGIETVSFPDSLERIGKFAFNSCEKLSRIVFRGSVKQIDEGAFTSCIKIENVVFPEGLLSIRNRAFDSYDSETQKMQMLSLYLPNSVNQIDEQIINKNRKITIYCHKGSYAENYARSHNYRVITDSRSVSQFISINSYANQSLQSENSSTVRQEGEIPTTIFKKNIEIETNDEQKIRSIAADACKNGRDSAWFYFILRNEWTLGVLNCSDDEFYNVNQKFFPDINRETLLMRRQQAMPWLNDQNTYNYQIQMLYSTDFEQRYTMLVCHFLDRITPTDPWQHINNAFAWLRNFFSPQEQQILWNRLCEGINAKKSNIMNQLSAINIEFTSFETAKQYLSICLEDPSLEKYDRTNPYNYIVPDAYLSIGLFDQSRSGVFVNLIPSQAWVWNTTLDEIYRAAVRNIQDQRSVKSDGKELIRRLLPQYLY